MHLINHPNWRDICAQRLHYHANVQLYIYSDLRQSITSLRTHFRFQLSIANWILISRLFFCTKINILFGIDQTRTAFDHGYAVSVQLSNFSHLASNGQHTMALASVGNMQSIGINEIPSVIRLKIFGSIPTNQFILLDLFGFTWDSTNSLINLKFVFDFFRQRINGKLKQNWFNRGSEPQNPLP